MCINYDINDRKQQIHMINKFIVLGDITFVRGLIVRDNDKIIRGIIRTHGIE